MRILIFDDELDVLELYKAILTKRGYEVTTHPNCSYLFDRVTETKPDVIIMDNEMPALSGIEATKLLKHDDHFSNIPVISISANADGGKLAAEANADCFLSKPIRIGDLETAIRNVMMKSKAA